MGSYHLTTQMSPGKNNEFLLHFERESVKIEQEFCAGIHSVCRWNTRRKIEMISVSDFRNGVTFDMDGKVMQIVEFQHVKPGKGAAFVRVKMRNVITGGVTETTFNPNNKYPTAYIERKKMEYSYADGDLYYFMDMETYEMTPIEKDILDDSFKFVKENDTCTVMSYKGKVFGVEAPSFVDLVVTKTDPGFAGNTATNTLKPATVETGAEVKVPLFINEGDKISIDTRTGEYLGRAKG